MFPTWATPALLTRMSRRRVRPTIVVECRGHAARIRDIARDPVGPALCRGNRRRGLGGGPPILIEHRHVCALAAERKSDGASDSRTAARNDGDLPIEVEQRCSGILHFTAKVNESCLLYR